MPACDFLDLALSDAALDHVLIEEQLIAALVEAVTYRQMLTVCLALLSEREIRCQAQERRIRQLLGVNDQPADVDEADV